MPPFLAREGAVLARLDTPAVPRVLGADGGRLPLDMVRRALVRELTVCSTGTC